MRLLEINLDTSARGAGSDVGLLGGVLPFSSVLRRVLLHRSSSRAWIAMEVARASCLSCLFSAPAGVFGNPCCLQSALTRRKQLFLGEGGGGGG